MLSNIGTVILVAMMSVSQSTNSDYSYHADVSSPSVNTGAMLYLETDDDQYYFYMDLGFTCDFYFSDGSDDYIVNNLTFNTSIRRGSRYNDSIIQTYNITLTNSSTLHIYELDDLVYRFEWHFYHENDTCLFKWYSNFDSLVSQNSVVVLPNEEFLTDSSLSINVDMSSLYNQLYVFGQQYVGYATGYQKGYDSGYLQGYNDGQSGGYQIGYSDGFQEASDQDSVAVTIFTGICEVGLLPVNVFLGILNFEVFGINIGGFVASLMTVAIVVIVLRVILGAKSKDD